MTRQPERQTGEAGDGAGRGGAAAEIEAILAAPPFHRWLGPVLESAEAADGALTVRIPARPEFARIPGEPGFHGAIVAAAVDIAAHAAIALRTRAPTPTVDLRVDYLRASTGADLLARAWIVRAGRSLGTVRVDVSEPGGRAVAAGVATFFLRRD